MGASKITLKWDPKNQLIGLKSKSMRLKYQSSKTLIKYNCNDIWPQGWRKYIHPYYCHPHHRQYIIDIQYTT